MSFDEWMNQVDEVLFKEIGMSHMDIPDQTYRDYFDDGMSPEDAVETIMEEDEMFSLMDY